MTSMPPLFLSIFAEVKGSFRLFKAICKSIFTESKIISCPNCNQTLTEFQKSCDRCGSILGWD